MTGPLQGVRVVEMGLWVAGPAAGGILADWGAEVIKVEPPGGDPFRRLFANLAGLRAPGSPPFDLDNRGKRSVILDLTTDEGSDALSHVLATADVFLSNYRLASAAWVTTSPDSPQLAGSARRSSSGRAPAADRWSRRRCSGPGSTRSDGTPRSTSTSASWLRPSGAR
jgi:hypothetical protein